jgi:predicted P-loop ATPase/GTPase
LILTSGEEDLSKVLQVLKHFARVADTREEVLKYSQMAISEAWKNVRGKMKQFGGDSA